jgi:hypothetical protein
MKMNNNFYTNAALLTFYIFLGSLFLLLSFGIEKINFTNLYWMAKNEDLLSYHLPWEFYRKGEWLFPITKNYNYGLEISHSIFLSDNVTILNIILKFFDKILPSNFQYLSLWILICLTLQGFFSFKVIKSCTNNNIFSILGSIFFISSPILIDRSLIHISLAAHWLILAAFFLILRKNFEQDFLSWSILISFSIFINLSIFLIILIILFYGSLLKIKNIKFLFLFFTFYTCLILLNLFIIGFFSINILDYAEYGFGHYKSNLLTFLDPRGGISNINWSLFLPDIYHYKGEEEGFAYLGLGGILLLIFSLYHVIKNRIFQKRSFIFFIVLLFLFLILAISSKISFGKIILIDLELNKYIYGIFSSIRTSGRFIWPIYYAIFAFGIVSIFNIIKSKNTKYLTLVILLLIQLADLSSGFLKIVENNNNYKKQTVPSSNLWNSISKDYPYLRTTFIDSTSEQTSLLGEILLFSEFKGTNIIYLSRYDRGLIAATRYNEYNNFLNKKLDKNSIYYVHDTHKIHFHKIFKNTKYKMLFINNSWFLLHDKDNKYYKKLQNYDDLKIKAPLLNTEISPFEHKEYFGIGWFRSKSFWSDGKRSFILFGEENTKINEIIINAKIFNDSTATLNNFKFYVNNKEIKDIISEKKDDNYTIKITIPRNILLKENILELRNFNLTTRKDLKIAPDPRLLGINLNHIKFI